MSDGQYWNITTYYLVFAALNLGLTYLVFKAWRDHIKTWKLQESTWQILLLILAAILILFATLVLAFLFFATYEGWRSTLNPDTPAPMFELFWIVGIFAVSIPASFAGMLHTFVRKDFDTLIP